jgi:cytoskeleton protein RodZ
VPEPAVASTVASPPEPQRDHEIVLRAEADSWVEVHESGIEAPIYSRVMRAGETYRVPPQSGLTLATGNAGGLIILVDGEPTPALGPSGAVRRGIKLNAARLVAGTAGRD